jgi:hypothetical protein
MHSTPILAGFLAAIVSAGGGGIDQVSPEKRVALGREPGKLLTQAAEARPVGPFKALGHKLELIELAEPLVVGEGPTAKKLDKVYRLTVTGGPFLPAGMPWQLWVNGHSLGVAQESEDLGAISAIVLDPGVLTDKGTISVSLGDARRHALTHKLAAPVR